MDLERQAKLIKKFLAKADEASSLEQLADVVYDATSDPFLLSYSELLSTPAFFRLAGTKYELSLDLLRLFAFGTWIDYQRNAKAYPALVDAQIEKLKQLHLIKLMMQPDKDLKYDLLQRELGFPDGQDLIWFLQSCRNSGNINFKPNEIQKKIVVQSNGKDLLKQIRGEVITGAPFDAFLQEAAAVRTDPSGLMSNGIVKLVRVPVDNQKNSILESEFQVKAGCLFAMLMQHVINMHSSKKSFGGKIYPGMFIVVGNELFLRSEAVPTKPLTNDNSILDYAATETIFKDHTGLRAPLDGGGETILYPLYAENFFSHLRCDPSLLSNDHIKFPMVKALDESYTTFLRCHALFQSTSARSAVIVHVRTHYKYTSRDNRARFSNAMTTHTSDSDWKSSSCRHFLLVGIVNYANANGPKYGVGPVAQFLFIRDWETHVSEHLTEEQKLIFTASVRNFLINYFFNGFYPETMFNVLCKYRVKDGAFDFKGWLHNLLRVSKTSIVATTTEWNLLGLRGQHLLNRVSSKQLSDQFLHAIKKLELNARDGTSDHFALAKWRALNKLRDQNPTVYYKVLIDKFEEFAPIVYTPTIGVVSQHPSSMFQRSGIMHISKQDAGKMISMVNTWPADQVDMIVVTDGSGLSSFDDVGVQSVSIVMGKGDIYVAVAGINPHRVLPVVIDVGTNCQRLLDDPLYPGIQELRLKEEEYFSITDEFMKAISSRWKNVIVQFEHIRSDLGFSLLNRYKKSYAVFNDNIQGGIFVTIAGLLGAVRARRKPITDFAKQRIIVAADGSGGPVLEVVNAIIGTMQMIGGTTFGSAREQLWIVDAKGLITENRSDPRMHHLARKRRDSHEGLSEGASFINVVNSVKPDIIVLLSAAAAGLSSQEVIRAIKRSSSKKIPAIFAMSNSQCTAEEVFSTLGERAVFASTDNFSNVDLGKGKIGYSNYVNKIFLYPGVVLGACLSGTYQISDKMLYAAAKCLAAMVKDEDIVKGILYPPISSIHDITKKVAVAVLREAGVSHGIHEAGLRNLSEDQLLMYVQDHMWSPT